MGFALVYVGSVIIVDDLVPPELRASGHFGVAPIAGSAAGGLLYGLAGPRAMFLAALAAVTLGAVAALISAGASPRRTG